MKHWNCPECGRDYAYELPTCTWCHVDLTVDEPDTARVIAVTEVCTGSVGHEEVPYWCALVESTSGARVIQKFDHDVSVGDTVAYGAEEAAELAVVGILGTGTMGRGLTELLLGRGHRVVWCGRSADKLERAGAKLLERLGRVMDADQIEAAAARLETTTDYGALGACDVVIEAVVEEIESKRTTLESAESHMRPDAFLATNTSGLSIDDLAACLVRPERFGVLHFFNPPTRMRLVETAIGTKTSAETGEFLDVFARSLGKTPVRVAAKPAFAVNRALMPLLNEAVRELEESVASAEAIDEAIRLGLNHPMGPLALADLIGLDVVVDIMENLADRLDDETYAPRPLLRTMIEQGRLGRKTGSGFFEYVDTPR